METQEVFVNEEDKATLVCPQCSFYEDVNVAKFRHTVEFDKALGFYLMSGPKRRPSTRVETWGTTAPDFCDHFTPGYGQGLMRDEGAEPVRRPLYLH
jgi:hypothetical protein